MKKSFESILRSELQGKALRNFIFTFGTLFTLFSLIYLSFRSFEFFKRSENLMNLIRSESRISSRPSTYSNGLAQALCESYYCTRLVLANPKNEILLSFPDKLDTGLVLIESIILKSSSFGMHFLIPDNETSSFRLRIVRSFEKDHLILDLSIWKLLEKPLYISLLLLSLAVGFFFAIQEAVFRVSAIFGDEIQRLVKATEDSSYTFRQNTFLTEECSKLFEAICDKQSRLLDYSRKTFEIEKSLELSNVALQVSHDIRSPLAALAVVVGRSSILPEEDRILIRSAANRITDIANSLLEKNRKLLEDFSVELLASLLDSVMSEKRTQFRSKSNFEIDCQFDSYSYHLFAKVQPAELKRILSNLVNNSINALAEQGNINVGLSRVKDGIQISVKDNGRGIPSEIIGRLGKRGETYSTPGGSGLGLYHAFATVKSWGGTLEINSELGIGTQVTITLPEAPPPSWFMPELNLNSVSEIAVLDDDSSIHEIWKSRFDQLQLIKKGISVLHFSNVEAFSAWVSEQSDRSKVICLLDNEIRGSQETGLSLVRKYDLASHSVLVTSAFEDLSVREECIRLGVQIIPKNMAGYIPLEFGPV